MSEQPVPEALPIGAVPAGEQPTGRTTAEPGGRRRRPRPEPVTTLAGYFAKKTCRPPRFLADLTEANIWQFADDDVAASLATSREADPRFTRTVALAAAALQADDDRFRRPLLEFAWASAERRLNENPRYHQLEVAGGDAASRFRAISRALQSGLHESRRRVESLNLLTTAALWLHHTEALPLEVITDEVSAAVRDIPRLRRPSEGALAGFLADQARSGPKGLLPLVGIVEPWIQRSKEATRRAAGETERADSLAEAHTRTEAEARQARAELAELTSALEAARREADSTRGELDAARIHFEHGSAQLRSRVAAALGGRLQELMVTALDALAMEQPRTHVAQEKLDVAVDELRKQVEWLRSSD